ncbi:hypothetical protein CFC21_052322 [Triticum aestivum]|uniref:Uncharacterized protein ycf68 n=2 Tax=Triticum aestivum TaxID=4565 RepID=A0A3B6HWK2_WHEAT|nr:hypothetical protein CFC21_052322 [Triticum aestivum]
MAYSSCLNRCLKPNKLLLRRIDGAIQVRSHVDLTFYSLVGSRRSGGTTAPLFSRIHTSLISIWRAISRAPHASMHDTSTGEQRASTNWTTRSR